MWHEVQEQLLQLEADSRLITALLFKTSNNKCIYYDINDIQQ